MKGLELPIINHVGNSIYYWIDIILYTLVYLIKDGEDALKTNTGLVEYAKKQLGKPYWYGTYGKDADKSLYTSKKKQYPSHYLWSYPKKDEGKKVHDCVGLIKGYLWCTSPEDNNPKYNKNQDVSANGMRSRCTENGKMSSMPDVPGILVFMDKHVGVYIGGGYVVEARGHSYGVVKTKLSSRKWTSWGKCPWITYQSNTADSESNTEQKYKPTVKEWQLAAIADGFKFPKYGADGEWGTECESVAKKAVVKKRLTYKYRNLTKLVQRHLGVEVDGKCGKDTAAAIKEYQKLHGLVADGECGINTWKCILNV